MMVKLIVNNGEVTLVLLKKRVERLEKRRTS